MNLLGLQCCHVVVAFQTSGETCDSLPDPRELRDIFLISRELFNSLPNHGEPCDSFPTSGKLSLPNQGKPCDSLSNPGNFMTAFQAPVKLCESISNPNEPFYIFPTLSKPYDIFPNSGKPIRTSFLPPVNF